jgi:Cof subfamily protein (haloacid dehalogenase superfamily)
VSAPRCLAIDLDGTLLGPDGEVSARSAAAVRAACDTGMHVVLATARWFQLAERTARTLGLTDPIIACSGAEVRRLADGLDLMDVRVPSAFTDALYGMLDAAGAIVWVAEEERVVFRMDGPTPPQLGDEIIKIDALVGEAAASPRMVMIFGPEVNAQILADLAPRWTEEVRFLDSVIRGGMSVLTLTGHGADKGDALRIACADLGVDLADVIAFGDSEADIEMFRVAGQSVAMGQADDVVKSAATRVTASNADDGVAAVIEELLREISG